MKLAGAENEFSSPPHPLKQPAWLLDPITHTEPSTVVWYTQLKMEENHFWCVSSLKPTLWMTQERA